jgi:multidrug efflux system outer membrane protein
VLNDLVTTALRENKDLMIAAARVEEFAGNYGFVRSGLFPQVGAGYEARRQRDVSAGDRRRQLRPTTATTRY